VCPGLCEIEGGTFDNRKFAKTNALSIRRGTEHTSVAANY